MNWTVIKIGAQTFLRKAGYFLRRNAPQIMVGTGVAGFVGTAVVTGKAALKAQDILDEKDAKLAEMYETANDPDIPDYNEEERKTDEKLLKRKTAGELVKTFAPPVLLGGASAALIFGGHHMMGRRAAAALASAYEAQSKLRKYRKNVVEQLGSEVDKRLNDGLAIDKLDISNKLKEAAENEPEKKDEPETVTKPKEAEKKYEWLFGSETCGALHGSGVWRDDPELNRTFLLKAEKIAMDMLRAKGYLLINDILIDIFGADGTSYGATHGWIYYKLPDGSEPVVDFGLNDLKNNPGLLTFLNGSEPNVWLRFNCLETAIIDEIDRIHDTRYYKHPHLGRRH